MASKDSCVHEAGQKINLSRVAGIRHTWGGGH